MVTKLKEKELNKELAKMQHKAKHLILSDYYDSVRLSDIQYSILKQLTNAKTNKDINSYLWNTGLINKTLDYISAQIKLLRKGKIKIF